jgi:histidine triad (HIT) family protein
MMEDCIFCKIARGELETDKVMETEDVVAFKDIRPQAPVHVLVIPKKHIASAHQMEPEDAALIGRMHLVAREVANQLHIADAGYRLVTNIGHHGQQTVPHLHYHVLGGRQLGWPPG